MIYFIQSGTDGPIKIGYSQDPTNRLKQLQTGSPKKLKLLCAVEGGFELERRLHDSLCQYHLNNEWYHPVKEITQTLDTLKEPQLQEPAACDVPEDWRLSLVVYGPGSKVYLDWLETGAYRHRSDVIGLIRKQYPRQDAEGCSQ